MIDVVQKENNKQEFLKLLEGLQREGVDKDGLWKQLTKSDFFEAPASARGPLACPGGLCAHSLNVYYSLKALINTWGGAIPVSELPSDDSILIVGLFSAWSRMNKYDVTYRNVKRYYPGGKRQDENGAFDWESVKDYAVKAPEERLIYGDEGANTVFMLRTYVPLSLDESAALLHSHNTEADNGKDTLSVYYKYPLAALLRMAVMFANFLLDKQLG